MTGGENNLDSPCPVMEGWSALLSPPECQFYYVEDWNAISAAAAVAANSNNQQAPNFHDIINATSASTPTSSYAPSISFGQGEVYNPSHSSGPAASLSKISMGVSLPEQSSMHAGTSAFPGVPFLYGSGANPDDATLEGAMEKALGSGVPPLEGMNIGSSMFNGMFIPLGMSSVPAVPIGKDSMTPLISAIPIEGQQPYFEGLLGEAALKDMKMRGKNRRKKMSKDGDGPSDQLTRHGHRKRKRSARLDELVFEGFFQSDKKIYESFIRKWRNERNLVFYDCACGRRKAVHDLKKIKTHVEKIHADSVSAAELQEKGLHNNMPISGMDAHDMMLHMNSSGVQFHVNQPLMMDNIPQSAQSMISMDHDHLPAESVANHLSQSIQISDVPHMALGSISVHRQSDSIMDQSSTGVDADPDLS